MSLEDRLPDPAERETFRRDGVVHLPALLGSGWVEVLRAGIERNLREPGPNGHYIRDAGAGRRFFEDAYVWPCNTELRRFLFESRAAETAACLMGCSAVHLFFDNVFVKEPGSGARTPWHQDLPAVSLDGRMLSLWIALDEVPRTDGLELVRGSHRWPEHYVPVRFADGSPKTRLDYEPLVPAPDFEAARDTLDIVTWAMTPGDGIAFDGMTLHGSGENTTPMRRRAYSVRFAADGARYQPKGEDSFPRFPGHALSPGDELGSAVFPQLWPH